MSSKQFTNFKQQVIKVATDVEDFPLVYEKENGEIDGLSIKMMKALSSWLNFTFSTTVSAPDNSWGDLSNGTWTGLLGELEKGNANLTINFFIPSPERVEYFDSSMPYMSEGFGFALRMPDPIPQWKSLLKPFSLQVRLTYLVIVEVYRFLVAFALDRCSGGQAFLIAGGLNFFVAGGLFFFVAGGIYLSHCRWGGSCCLWTKHFLLQVG